MIKKLNNPLFEHVNFIDFLVNSDDQELFVSYNYFIFMIVILT